MISDIQADIKTGKQCHVDCVHICQTRVKDHRMCDKAEQRKCYSLVGYLFIWTLFTQNSTNGGLYTNGYSLPVKRKTGYNCIITIVVYFVYLLGSNQNCAEFSTFVQFANRYENIDMRRGSDKSM